MANRMTDDDFGAGMSDADWEKAEAIESEIARILSEGFSKDVGIKFVRTVMDVQAVMPDTTVEGVYEVAMRAGLMYLGDAGTLARMRSGQFTWPTNGIGPKAKSRTARRSKLSGDGV